MLDAETANDDAILATFVSDHDALRAVVCILFVPQRNLFYME